MLNKLLFLHHEGLSQQAIQPVVESTGSGKVVIGIVVVVLVAWYLWSKKK
jgi:hypothetical protein